MLIFSPGFALSLDSRHSLIILLVFLAIIGGIGVGRVLEAVGGNLFFLYWYYFSLRGHSGVCS